MSHTETNHQDGKNVGSQAESLANLVDISQPHDRLIKVLLSQPETTDNFFREYLPIEILEQMAPCLPELVEGSFVPDALSLFISDKLFRVKMAQGASAFIHILTEHKSYPDRKVGWQITRGIMACTEQSIREMGKNWESLPAVISVLIYHGNSPWNYPNDLISLVDANSAMHPWLLNVRYILVDLSATADPLLSRHARLRAGFLALKYGTRSPEEQMEAIGQIADALKDAPELLVPVMIYLMNTFTLLQKETVHEIIMQVKPEEETEMMSIFAQELMAKGEARGEARGRRVQLLRQIQRKFGSLSSQVQAQVENADLSTLDTWADRILDARTLDDLFGTQEHVTAH
ncbi:MAG: Rpn family recombination-promoting nuclease/putative transposase [Magnetococcales bacterium]|nr:Rpn family recombination-promoting nuclease/putative transposase [Magnetococcales bacterium]